MPDPEQHIQSRTASIVPFPPSGGVGQSPPREIEMGESPRWDVGRGMLFGAGVGLLVGPLAAVAGSWFLAAIDFTWAIILGLALGLVAGACIGALERHIRGHLVRPDIATLVCVTFGLPLSLLILVNGNGVVVGRLSGFIFIGTAAAGPMLGLLIGALLDRGYEAFLNRSWASGMGFVGAGVASSLTLLALFLNTPSGLAQEEVAREVRPHIIRLWRMTPALENATIQKITLEHKGGGAYHGTVDAMIGMRLEQFWIEVFVDGAGAQLKLTPTKQ